MDDDYTGKRLGFLCSRIDDPRRIQLREGRFLKAYHERNTIDDDAIEIGHELTKLRRIGNTDVADALMVFQRPAMYSVEYTHDREYPLHPRVPLPKPRIPDRSFATIVRDRRSRRHFDRRAIVADQLSALLFCAAGESGHLPTGSKPEVSLRTIPSGGALHPTRVFVAVLQAGDFARGLYHYDVPDHELEFIKPLSDPDIEALFAAFPIHPDTVDLSECAAIFFLSTKFWRSRAKYGPRGYRYCLQEVGAACQNLSLAAGALDLAHVVLGGFYDDEVHRFLEIDGVDHAVITTIAVGCAAAQSRGGREHVEF